MRILFVSHTLPLPGQPVSNIGGMQRMAAEMRAALEARPSVSVTSLVLESSGRWAGARTAPFLARLLWEIPRMVRRESIDVVLFSSMVTAATAVPLRQLLRGSGVIMAATPVGRDVTLPQASYQRFVPRVFRSLDLVMPISRATGEECLARGLKRRRMEIVPVGIDVARFPEIVDRAGTRAALLAALRDAGQAPLPEGALLLCSVGRHQERKGFQWFVSEVMPRLPDDVVYLLGGDGPMTPRIREAVARAGLEKRVRLLGRVSEELLGTLYRGADLFVMPNVPVPGDIEGFGVVMLEAGLSGLPLVAADLEGIRDVVTEGENGHLIPTGNAAAFVAAIEGYRADPQALRAASSAARDFTAGRFSWPAVAARYVAALESSLARRRRSRARR